MKKKNARINKIKSCVCDSIKIVMGIIKIVSEKCFNRANVPSIRLVSFYLYFPFTQHDVEWHSCKLSMGLLSRNLLLLLLFAIRTYIKL